VEISAPACVDSSAFDLKKGQLQRFCNKVAAWWSEGEANEDLA